MRKQLGRYGATDERQAEFARKHPGDLIICLTLPPQQHHHESPRGVSPKRNAELLF